tara:strand:+ start:470 stop:670 length:201 start_codon:yes stop_codon:yes gene_type:complete
MKKEGQGMEEPEVEVLSSDEMSDKEMMDLYKEETKKRLELIMDSFIRVSTPPSLKDIEKQLRKYRT